MNWIIRENGFDKERIAANGNKFMIGNGYMGYRGTLDEFARSELTATIPAGLYDKVGDQWREPINAPNGLSTRIVCDGKPLSVLELEPLAHEQELDIRHGVHRRKTVYPAADGRTVTVESERFCSMERLHLLANRVSVTCSKPSELIITTGIDGQVWDINGPHLERMESAEQEDTLTLTGWTHELNMPVSVGHTLACLFGERRSLALDHFLGREIRLAAQAGETYTFVTYVSVFTGLDGEADCAAAAAEASREAAAAGYESLLAEHAARWERKWKLSDVRIEGDDEAQLALRYSLYQLHIIAPGHSEKLSIPARGLSGQVYKGAVFWDTEMFMLPFFLYTQPSIARNLMMYRVHTLDGARRKAAEYGYAGAFYAWESQETGDDACTLFNVNDVFTGRPMRTYFRDKQVHISADVAYGIWQYFIFTGDDSILLDGGAEAVLECARFFYSYAYYNPYRSRYEILDVTGPDEYHERVNNNAFTNAMAKRCLNIALEVLAYLQDKYPGLAKSLTAGGRIATEQLRDMHDRLYIPQPAEGSGVIEQFDRYFALEDVTLAQLKSRILNRHEYLGGGNGLATTTQILKQADVVLMLHLFKDEYSRGMKRSNWEYYEPRTEHGSSLSYCIYALVAADIGLSDWAYPYFKRTATIDLTGDSKQYVGDLYIGGTHPAANGGAWMAAVLGFAGLRFDGQAVTIAPSLPAAWRAVSFPLQLRGAGFIVTIETGQVRVEASEDNQAAMEFRIERRNDAGDRESAMVAPGQHMSFSYK
ncbi:MULTISPECIES: glycoside hydrolase family 65 protein [unclassified Paenibacillus]|uniref:glycoside hydrolase family 65 protein n=1 Tax=unclassified Paenibacillus TaxID=185978 RepID=UPI001C11B99F|nr:MULTISPECIES: glycosyl hydrolase family 65 protein [unclassified Paenibacillus]MBU5444559.1 glycoside hydrolase family 65 protein [Paenibacillus sp. MSJ-34]CAH0120221.1 Nigerose phosphorylase [Paenibacillus sp. CECT 9249]